MAYSIWLEFEQYVDADAKDIDDGYCNIAVTYDDGRQQGYNVWTVAFLRDNIESILNAVEEEGFATFPDIIVSRLDREYITEVLKKLLGPCDS